MDAHPHLAEALIHQVLLCLLHHGKLLRGNGLAVDKAGGKAGVGRLIPGGKAKLMGKLSDLGLRKARVPKRAFNSQLGDGPVARAVVLVVVQIGSLDDTGEAVLGSDSLNVFKEGALAEIAAVRRIFREALHGHDVEIIKYLADPLPAAEVFRLAAFPPGESPCRGRDGHGTASQGGVGRLQKEGGIHAARKGHGRAPQPLQVLLQ